MHQLEPLMRQNFLEYASYVIMDRAIPDVRDGCKPVQRRILHTLFAIDDGKFHKVANVIGEAMKLHPHGDASIGDALVVLANKEYFIDKQGNFGNVLTGHQAAAARYIECRLTPLAKETLFNENLTAWQPSYDGRRNEPVYLPAKLPVVLMLGTEGIAVGMTTKILPHNLPELWQAQIALLRGQTSKLVPDFVQGGIMDASDYQDGRGKVRVRAKMESDGDKRIVIRQIPFGTTTDSLIASVESAIQKNKVKISSISDFTGDAIEIELTLPRGTYADEVIPQLYAYTDCEVTINSSLTVIESRHPREKTVTDVLAVLTAQLREQIEAELKFQLAELLRKVHQLVLEQVFLQHKVYQRLELVKDADGLKAAVEAGMAPHRRQFVQPLSQEDITRLLDIRIRRISAFDLAKNRADVDATREAIAACEAKLQKLTKATIAYLTDLLKRYGKQYPRRTQVATFAAVDRKAVARQHIKLNYDAASGFFGFDVKATDRQLTVSEYDLVLAISEHGKIRLMTPQAKVLLGKVLYLEPFAASTEMGETFVVAYTDAKKLAFGKRFTVRKLVKNREYNLCPEGSKIHLLARPQAARRILLKLVAGARAKQSEAVVQVKEIKEVAAIAGRGQRLAAKPVGRMTLA